MVYLGVTPEKEQFVVSPENARITFCTSFVALSTLALAAVLRVYDGIAVTTLVFLTSVNYWRRPVYGFRRNLDIAAAGVCLAYQTLRSFSVEPLYQAGYLTSSYAGVVIYFIGLYLSRRNRRHETTGAYMHAITHALGNVGNVFLYVGLNRVHNRWTW